MIRRAKKEEAQSFFQTHLDCWKETYELFFKSEVFIKREAFALERIKHIETRIAQNFPYYVLEINHKIEGIMILNFDVLNNMGVLDSIYIKKAYQRKGYGKEMLKHASIYFIKLGGKEMSVSCLKGLPANTFFAKHKKKALEDSLVTIGEADFVEHNYLIGCDFNE